MFWLCNRVEVFFYTISSLRVRVAARREDNPVSRSECVAWFSIPFHLRSAHLKTLELTGVLVEVCHFYFFLKRGGFVVFLWLCLWCIRHKKGLSLRPNLLFYQHLPVNDFATTCAYVLRQEVCNLVYTTRFRIRIVLRTEHQQPILLCQIPQHFLLR